MMLIQADAARLPLRDGIVQCVCTSPPFWGLRDYKTPPLVWGGEEGCEHRWGVERIVKGSGGLNSTTIGSGLGQSSSAGSLFTASGGQWCQTCGAWRGSLGLEPTPEAYVQHLVEVFREVRRVLRDDGTCWLNLGDSFARPIGKGVKFEKKSDATYIGNRQAVEGNRGPDIPPGLKNKDLIGIPWMVAFALRADGWYLRSDIIWAKGYSFHQQTSGSCMPESVRDRPTRGHEYLFLLSKNQRYYYDAEAVKEQGTWPAGTRAAKGSGTREGNRRGTRKKDQVGTRGPSSERTQSGDFQDRCDNGYATYSGKRNLRSVWIINPKPYREAHFATFPPALVEPCIKAGSKPGDLVMDPFSGSGTTALVAKRHGRRVLGCDLNPAYHEMAQESITGPLFAEG